MNLGPLDPTTPGPQTNMALCSIIGLAPGARFGLMGGGVADRTLLKPPFPKKFLPAPTTLLHGPGEVSLPSGKELGRRGPDGVGGGVTGAFLCGGAIGPGGAGVPGALLTPLGAGLDVELHESGTITVDEPVGLGGGEMAVTGEPIDPRYPGAFAASACGEPSDVG